MLVLPTASLFPALARERETVGERFLAALSKSSSLAATELESAWNIFEAGLGQSLLGLREDQDPARESEHWIAFGTRGLGDSGDSAPEKEDDKQGMLFEF